MAAKPPPSKEALLSLIAKQRAEPEITALPYREQQDFVLDPDHPLRSEMRQRDKAIRQGLKHHKLNEADLEQD